jgi:molybdopterin converting factor small subunit
MKSGVIQICLPPSLQPQADNLKQIDISGRTLGECLENLVKQYRSLEKDIFDQRRRVQRGLGLYLNGENIDDLNIPVNAGDKIYIVNILAGG